LLKGLLVNLQRNSFESERIEQILLAAPPLAGAIFEWVRLGGLSQAGIAEDDFESWFYEAAKEVCDSVRSDLEI
jgi:hypothetical protein